MSGEAVEPAPLHFSSPRAQIRRNRYLGLTGNYPSPYRADEGGTRPIIAVRAKSSSADQARPPGPVRKVAGGSRILIGKDGHRSRQGPRERSRGPLHLLERRFIAPAFFFEPREPLLERPRQMGVAQREPVKVEAPQIPPPPALAARNAKEIEMLKLISVTALASAVVLATAAMSSASAGHVGGHGGGHGGPWRVPLRRTSRRPYGRPRPRIRARHVGATAGAVMGIRTRPPLGPLPWRALALWLRRDGDRGRRLSGLRRQLRCKAAPLLLLLPREGLSAGWLGAVRRPLHQRSRDQSGSSRLNNPTLSQKQSSRLRRELFCVATLGPVYIHRPMDSQISENLILRLKNGGQP